MPASCRCGRTWTGMSQAHCSVCHRHFSSVANFDRHKPSYAGCLDPADVVNGKGELVMKRTANPYGETWVGAGEYRGPGSVDPGNDADPATTDAA